MTAPPPSDSTAAGTPLRSSARETKAAPSSSGTSRRLPARSAPPTRPNSRPSTSTPPAERPRSPTRLRATQRAASAGPVRPMKRRRPSVVTTGRATPCWRATWRTSVTASPRSLKPAAARCSSSRCSAPGPIGPRRPGSRSSTRRPRRPADDGRVQAARRERRPRRLGGLGQLPLLPLVRLVPLYQSRTAGADRVDLGPVRQDEEQTPFDPRPGPQTPLHVLHPGGAQQRHIDAEGGEALQPAANEGGGGRPWAGDDVPPKAHHGERSVDLLGGVRGHVHAPILPQALPPVRRAPSPADPACRRG